MPDTTLPALLGTGDHASRPAANTVGSGALYSCSDHDLVYQSDGSAWSTWATLGGSGAANLQSARYVRTAGNYAITGAGSDSFANVDNTNLSFTFTTGARKVLLGWTSSVSVSNAAGGTCWDIELDGSRVSGVANGLLFVPQHATVESVPIAFTYLTDTLTAASHTFKLQWRQFTTSHTATINGSDPVAVFYAIEQYA
jgi:hypothetical protein